MKLIKLIVFIAVITAIMSSSTWAHFGMLIPSDSMVMQQDTRTVTLKLSFSHPFEMVGMEMAKPRRLSVWTGHEKTSLLDSLEATREMGHSAWKAAYAVKRPGVYVFFMEPEPYWEPAEDAFIIHFTKTVVTAFGDDDGWGQELGLETEIVPLAKPFGLYTGNVFQGIVKLSGQPVPFAEVEVEYYNINQQYTAPTTYMVTQTIKADGNGVFTYAAPVSGWWGFAALNTADYKLSHQGQEKDVELGAVIWVYFHDMQ